MKTIERSRNHHVLSECSALSHELYATVFSTVSSTGSRWYDVSCLTENPKTFRKVIEYLKNRYEAMGADGPTHILGIESRGGLIGAPLALALGIPFVFVRVTKRFPSSFVSEDSSMRNLPQSHSIRHNSINTKSRVVVVDDFIAKGNTMISSLRLTDIVGAHVVELLAMCDVIRLEGVSKIHQADDGFFKEIPVFTLIRFDGDCKAIREQLEAVSSFFARSRL